MSSVPKYKAQDDVILPIIILYILVYDETEINTQPIASSLIL